MQIKIIINSNQTIVHQFDYSLSGKELYHLYQDSLEYEALALRVNNQYQDLNYLFQDGDTVEFLDLRSNYAWLVYQNSLLLVYLKATQAVLGKVHIEIANSLNQGLYTTVKTNFSKEDVQEIEQQMHEIIAKDLPITKTKLDLNNISHLSNEDEKQSKLLKALTAQTDINVYSIENTNEVFYTHLLPSTGYLNCFELRPYHNGILLRYPHPENPLNLPEYVDQKLLYNAFSEAQHFENLMSVNYVQDLNEKIIQNDYEDLIALEEALHEKKIAEIADIIKEKNRRIILVCGPTSSGKTSFAKRLCTQLRVTGLKPLYIGVDDYFLDRNETPVLPNGDKDYESINAVDLKLFNSQINALLNGKKVDIPAFDFIEGKKHFGKRMVSIEKNQPIVIEGIHALNEILTREISNDVKYKIYISPLTGLGIDSFNRIPTTDARMLRRIVRDYQTRGRNAETTILDWPNVRKGENQNIFPYTSKADIFFNTNYIYELAVLKKIAEPLLKEIPNTSKAFAEAQRILSFLKFFRTIEDSSYIANNSILREFIGGSVLLK